MSGTVDEILARGWYVDRKSRRWHLRRDGNWQHDLGERKTCLVAAWYMRLLVERDQHRDECDGLEYCPSHPVPHVIVARYRPAMFSIHEAGGRSEAAGFRGDLAAAVDAARALAVGE